MKIIAVMSILWGLAAFMMKRNASANHSLWPTINLTTLMCGLPAFSILSVSVCGLTTGEPFQHWCVKQFSGCPLQSLEAGRKLDLLCMSMTLLRGPSLCLIARIDSR
jgi:hypothetical protein